MRLPRRLRLLAMTAISQYTAQLSLPLLSLSYETLSSRLTATRYYKYINEGGEEHMVRLMIVGMVASLLSLFAVSTSFGQTTTTAPTTAPSPTTTTVPSGAPSTGFGR